MASTATDVRANLKGISERGIYGWYRWLMSLDAAQSFVDVAIDTINIGGVGVAWFIDNLTASGGTTSIKFTPQVSNDGVNWTNVAWKDETGSATTSGEATLASNSTKWVIISYASYPEVACARHFRLHCRAGTALLSAPIISVTVK